MHNGKSTFLPLKTFHTFHNNFAAKFLLKKEKKNEKGKKKVEI